MPLYLCPFSLLFVNLVFKTISRKISLWQKDALLQNEEVHCMMDYKWMMLETDHIMKRYGDTRTPRQCHPTRVLWIHFLSCLFIFWIHFFVPSLVSDLKDGSLLSLFFYLTTSISLVCHILVYKALRKTIYFVSVVSDTSRTVKEEQPYVN